MTAREPWASYRADVAAQLRESAGDAPAAARYAVLGRWLVVVDAIRWEYSGDDAARAARMAAAAEALADTLGWLDQAESGEGS